MNQSGGAEEAPAEVPVEAQVGNITNSDSNAPTDFAPEEIPLKQKIAKGGVKINENIGANGKYFATLDE